MILQELQTQLFTHNILARCDILMSQNTIFTQLKVVIFFFAGYS